MFEHNIWTINLQGILPEPLNGRQKLDIAKKDEKSYNICVTGKKHLQRLTVSALAILTLSSCGAKEASKDEAAFRSALMAIEPTLELLQAGSKRASSLIGVYAASFFMNPAAIPFRSALMGINAQVRLFVTPEQQKSEAFALLQELGGVLQVDVADMLNRSDKRDTALDAYLEGMREIMQRSKDKTVELDQLLDSTREELSAARKRTSTIRTQLNRALRDQDYATAGARQQTLSDLQIEETRVANKEKELRSQISLFEDLLDVGEERWNAITKNREILIAGLQVVDVPGITDIGIYREETRDERNERNSEDFLFGEPLSQ